MWSPSPNLCSRFLELGTLTVEGVASVKRGPVGSQFLNNTNVLHGLRMLLMLKFEIGFGALRDQLYHIVNFLGVYLIFFTTLGSSVKIHHYIVTYFVLRITYNGISERTNFESPMFVVSSAWLPGGKISNLICGLLLQVSVVDFGNPEH